MSIITNFEKIKQEINNNSLQNEIEVIAVSKTFSIEHVMPLVEHGHKHFGENKVQEAEKKWKELKKSNNDISLHMIGRLQSNKAKKDNTVMKCILILIKLFLVSIMILI